ncbi:MBL fold metallo-hydrolase [Nocardia abscessus]|uniref:MBL fold metallo-hydrolase n=1 Tax=Nocardia abscessus TaxID=120957 RepID=UPI001896099C|nr:MBL fold metallo-hydrolase [Nocardia abscessus]MBF6339214.1 MBL fold metallo-hydrolase [Nocardia abscessus]
MGKYGWAEEGLHPVAPGIHRVPLPLPSDALAAVNVYVVETEDGLTVIDGGWNIPAARTVFDRALAELGWSTRDIRQFLVTHAHRDHYTQAVALAAELGCRVRLGTGEKEYLDAMRADPTGSQVHTRTLEQAGAADLIPGWRTWLLDQEADTDMWSDPTDWLDDDRRLLAGTRRLRAVATPGHTRGHIVFAEEEAGLLFTGDHILPTITPSVGFEPGSPEVPLREFLASLAKVRVLPDMRLLPAHGPITESSHARIDELVAHHDRRLDLCLRAVADGAATTAEVATLLPWTKRLQRLDQLEPYNAALAIVETMQHLDLLAVQQRLAVTERDGVSRWSLSA